MTAIRTRRSTAALVGVLLAASLLVWPTTSAAEEQVGFKHAFEKEFAGVRVTGEKPESKLWFHDGSWWATMLDATGARHTIHELDGDVWVDTDVEVDESPLARGDALVVGDRLYITNRPGDLAGGVRSDGPSRLFRADYDATARTWLPEGGPVDLPVDGDAAALTIARDTEGRLWLAWFGSGAAQYAVSDDDGDTWGPATTLPFPEATVDGAATAAIIAFTDDEGPAVGIMWSRQDNGSSAQSFAVHRDGDPTEQWDREIAIEGSSQADDHINLKTRDGSVYAAVKTEANEEGQTLIKVLVRSPAGDWEAHPVAAFGDSDTRPIAVLELSGSNAYVFTSREFVHSVDPDTGEEKTSREIVLRQAPISELDADAGGNPFSEPEVFIRSDTSKGVDDATSMKANPTADSDIVVMASTSSHYWWNRREVDAPPPPPSPEFELTTSVEGEGAVDPQGGTYDEGEEVDLTATAATGWHFTGWSPNVTLTGDNTGTVLMTADTHVTATFAREIHALTTTTDGDGTILLDPPGGTYDHGTEVILTASAQDGHTFAGWSGDLGGAANPATLVMDGAKSVTAQFEPVNVPDDGPCDVGACVPVTGDWDDDGTATPGWFSPREGRWYVRTADNSTHAFNYGGTSVNNVPVVGDWNGDGTTTIGVVRDDGTWHLRNSNSGGRSQVRFKYGRVARGDLPITGDWNGNDTTTIGIVRDGTWHLRNSNTGGPGQIKFKYGRVKRGGDIPLTGDWNGDGTTTAGIIRDEGDWHLRNSNTGGPGQIKFKYGRVDSEGDVPVTGDWDANDTTTVGVVRDDVWYLKNRNAGGGHDEKLAYRG